VRKIPPGPFVYPLTNRKLAGEAPISRIVEELCAGGARMIQLREKDVTTRTFLELALEAVSVARSYNAILMINDRVDIAMMAGADGVHLGEDDLPPADARRLLGPEAIIGLSCHSLDDVQAVAREPVDYIAVGPVFPTDTKELRYPVAGTELVGRARTLTSLPLVAIGGIGRDTAGQVVDAGADGIAVISALMVPGEVESRTRELIAAIQAG